MKSHFDLILKKKYDKDERVNGFNEPIKDVFFSNSGNLMVVMKTNSFEIYGGPNLKYITAFTHYKVSQVKFCPLERYLVSINGTSTDLKRSENVIVWNLYTGKRLRIFKLIQEDHKEFFGFSYDG